MLYVICGIILFLILLFIIIFLHFKKKYDFYFLKVSEANNNIEIIIEKKIEILLKIAQIIDKDKIKELEDSKERN